MQSELLVASINIVICSLFGFLIGPLVKYFGLKYNILDIPNSRKIHKSPIVRIGGLTILVTFLLFFFINYLLFKSSNTYFLESQKILIIIIGSFFYFLLGLHDDIYRSSPVLRLSIQFIIAFSVSLLGINLSNLTLSFPFFGSADFTLPIFLSHLLTCFWIVGITNAINWIDGLDGLAAGFSCIVSIAILISSYILGNTEGIVMFSILLGSILGFLLKNFKPAFYIMGDCGSYFLGFILSTGAIYFPSKGFENPVPFLYIIILFSLPIFDMIFVILNRISKNLNPLKPDANHIHHRLIRSNISYKQIITIIYTYSMCCIILSNKFLLIV